jgi:hypothetical protein
MKISLRAVKVIKQIYIVNPCAYIEALKDVAKNRCNDMIVISPSARSASKLHPRTHRKPTNASMRE